MSSNTTVRVARLRMRMRMRMRMRVRVRARALSRVCGKCPKRVTPRKCPTAEYLNRQAVQRRRQSCESIDPGRPNEHALQRRFIYAAQICTNG